MAVEFRSYRDSDRDSLFEITSDVWSVFGPSSEMHIGDLSWALLQSSEQVPPRIWLAFEDGLLVGFACLTSPRWCDFVLRPALPAPTVDIVVEEFIRWADETASAIPLSLTAPRLLRFGRRICDPTLAERIESMGFRRMESGFPTLCRPPLLDGRSNDVAEIPGGFEIAEAGDLAEDSRRAAWNSAFPIESLPREFYLNLPKAKDANPQLDLAVVDANRIVASFLTVWHDEATRSALFEPVGCHADFQRRGLARILVEEACRRLAALSVELAFVRVSSTNPATRRFYEACGFVVASSEFGFERPL